MKKYSTIFKLINEAWKVDKKYFLFLFSSIIFQTASTILVMYIPAIIIDKLSNKYTFENILKIVVVFMLASYLLKQALEFINYHLSRLKDFQSQKLAAKLSEKTLTITYKELENPKSLDLIQRAEMPISWGYVSVFLEFLKSTFVSLFTIVGLTGILLSHSLIYTFVVFVIIFISFFIRISWQDKYNKIITKNVSVNRKFGYFIDATTSEKNQKEFRLFNLSEIMTSKLNKYNVEVYEWIKSLHLIGSNLQILDAVSSSLVTFIAISYNVIRLFKNVFGPIISIGQFTLIYNSTNTIVINMQQISSSLSTINQSVAYLTPWKDFLEMEDENFLGNKKATELETLEFKNVSFTYPNSDKLILNNISFKINKGEKISIVGLNNAGKSTIVKLIARFFKPDSGEIFWNGKNIYEYDESSYIDQISAVFQDFKLFPYTILENIMPYENNLEKAEESLKKVNMYEAVSKLKNGINTFLSKELEVDATKFSGGQSQKLAIARAINKNGSLMIMDEPTAALDPIAESEIFENFSNLTKGKTSIFISHRMASSIFSDKILLLDDGKIVGFDSHKNLMSEHNLYRDLFETQAKNYVK